MSTITDRRNKIHIGRNIKRFREILGVKQESLAITMGEEWNQKRISMLESKPKIDDELLEQVAEALKIPVEAIKNFDEEKTILNIQNNYEGANPVASGSGSAIFSGTSGDTTNNNDCTFNPLDKLVETMEELKSLYAENKDLYERMLQTEKEKFELLKATKK